MTHHKILYFTLVIGVATLVTGDSTEQESTDEPPSQPVSVRLLYGESQGVSWTDLASPMRLDPIFKKKYIDIIGLDYHYGKGLLFYSAFDGIWRLPIDLKGATGSPEQFVPDTKEATSIAVDWVRDRIYWITPAEATVQRIGLDGVRRELVMTLPEGVSFGEFSNIVLDPQSRFLFLATDGNSFIRANINGGGVRHVRPEGLRDQRVVSLAIDTHMRRLYVSSSHDYVPQITSCDYDGSYTLEYDLSNAWWDKFPSIDVFGDQLFWVHQGWQERDTVWKANMSSAGALSFEKEYTAPETVLGTSPKIRTVRVYHPGIQKFSNQQETLEIHDEDSNKANEVPSTALVSSSVSKTKSNTFFTILCIYL